jgi:hypothetical protein
MMNEQQNPEKEVIDLGETEARPITERVDSLIARVKKIVTTDEGKLQILMETEGLSDEALANVKDMLVLQQAGMVAVSMKPLQRELFDA